MEYELEQHLREMGLLTKEDKPQEEEVERVVYDYSFKDPRDANGEVQF